MDHYSIEQLNNIHSETFAFISCSEKDHVLCITLDREEKKNAIHPHMVNELAFALNYAHSENNIWAVIIQAKGNVFCAGADLKAFMGILGEFDSSIPQPKNEVLIGELFSAVHKPVIAKIEGDVYAGGFFFLAGSTYVVANSNIKLGLPEVKKGLFPFQVMAALINIMPARKVIDWCIRGYNLPAKEANKLGLITHLSNEKEIDEAVNNLIDELKENSPSAIRLGLEAYEKITNKKGDHQYLMEMLQKTVMTKDGQEGINAFREKRKPNWTGE
jgi:enoyl-CoA hydratase/carnithine racemase